LEAIEMREVLIKQIETYSNGVVLFSLIQGLAYLYSFWFVTGIYHIFLWHFIDCSNCWEVNTPIEAVLNLSPLFRSLSDLTDRSEGKVN
jgi:hypothetical protein